VTLSKDGQFYLFFDNFRQTWGLWSLRDMTQQRVGISLKILSEKRRRMSENQKKIHDANTKSIRAATGEISLERKKTIEQDFPEVHVAPESLPPQSQQIYVKKYLKAVNLQDIEVEIETRPLDCDSWEIH
jgi:hypothetical protein